MKITPLDLRKPDFKKSFKGYDVDEVRGLLAAAADSLEEALREKLDLGNRVIELTERLRNYQNMENTLNETLILAQKAGESARQAAQRESELIVAKAEVEAEKMLDAARARLRELKFEIEHLHEEKQSFLVKMRSLVASQWKLLQDESAEGATRQPPVRESFEEEPTGSARPATDEQFVEAPAEDEAPEVQPQDRVRSGGPRSSALEAEAFAEVPNVDSEGDSVKNLSRKLGEFLRSKEAVQEREKLDRERPDTDSGAGDEASGLDWGGQEEREAGARPELFWGSGDEEDGHTKDKGRGKK